ncbi:nucleotidyltransferase domain-containing protein [Salinicoccus sesuvii]|uniref:Nucleotidyltransferase domain-containing protein n=1 Tax=Salinicoccus sesuvii TaxID=868281 RepID=A0ABV7N2R6_9STAP
MSFSLSYAVDRWMNGFKGRWCIADGWAIDLFLEKETRVHSDIEVMVFRDDQKLLEKHFSDWHISKVEDGKLVTWKGEYLKKPTHELHATHKTTEWKIEMLLNEEDEENWVFRREKRIRKPLAEIVHLSRSGLPYLSLEVVLLYKAKSVNKKDIHDFNKAVCAVSHTQRAWLQDALYVHLPKHTWLEQLERCND